MKKIVLIFLFLCGVSVLNFLLFLKSINTLASPRYLVSENTVSKIEGVLQHTTNFLAFKTELSIITAGTGILTLPQMDFEDLKEKKANILLLIIVRSGADRKPRRDALRETWWKHCRGAQVRNQTSSSSYAPKYTNYIET